MKLVHLLVGTVLAAAPRVRRDQRGLSQSTEIALLTAAVLGVVTIIVVAITAYVNAKLPRP
jgi:hypothetical protein